MNKAIESAAQALALREQARAAGKDAATIELLYLLPMRQCAAAALAMSGRKGGAA
jgi:hypothetical protein